MKNILGAVLAAALCIGGASTAQAGLYTSNYGTLLTGPSNCDDCYAGPIAFSGVGQSIKFFGTSYDSLYVGSNGYVTFGSGQSSFSTAPLDTQNVAPMIAAFYTDLDSRGDDASNVYVNTLTNGEIVATWEMMGHFNQNYSVRSTFQLVIRSDQASVPSDQGRIGFFYGDISDDRSVAAGFGDGLSTVNEGEVAFASFVPGTSLGNSSRFFAIDEAGVPSEVPEPASLALLGAGLAGFLARRRRKSA